MSRSGGWIVWVVGLVTACGTDPEVVSADVAPESDAAIGFVPTDAGSTSVDSGPPPAQDASSSDEGEPALEVASPADTAAAEDDAEVVFAEFVSELACGAEAVALVTMRNTGTATWTRAGGYKLGAVDDSDPLKAGDPRIWLAEGDAVPPGGEHTFEIPLQAPDEAATVHTDWRMVHEAVTWFGETAAADVAVVCDAVQYPLPLPDMSDLVDQVAADHPDLLADSCQDEGGTWEFLDLLVTELRKVDVRWGYNWKRGKVGDPSQDVVDYHFGPGESEGSTDVYIIDVIVGHCGPNPSPGWIDQTQATADAGEIGRWTSMGKF